ncbi:MAG: MoxR family ATPase [Bryobacteraceae bacterium]
MFESIDQLRKCFLASKYLADDVTLQHVLLAARLKKPLLVEGPPGAGKTELARVVALAANTRLIRLQCYEGITEEKAIGRFDEALQRLYLSLRDPSQPTNWSELKARLHTIEFFSAGPVLESILTEEPAVLLLDEIDKVSEGFEALILEVLSEWQVSVPKLGTIQHKSIPFVVMTSNAVRRIGDPLRRRSMYLRFENPTIESERRILQLKSQGRNERLRSELAGLAKALRGYSLEKPPSIAEILDVAEGLHILDIGELSAGLRDVLLPLLAKTHPDRKRMLLREGFKFLVANAKQHAAQLEPEEREALVASTVAV